MSLTPPETVVAAMPGTLAELAERTGFDPAVVLRLIVRARVDGVRVNAIDPPGDAPTIFHAGSPVVTLDND